MRNNIQLRVPHGRKVAFLGGLLIAASLWLSGPARGRELPRALPAGQLPDDERLQDLRDLNGYFPFVPPATRQAWDKRAEEVRRRLRVSLGLWPLPTKGPLNAVIHGRVERDEYSVEKVFFESMPGFYVTGSLYRPKAAGGTRPGVLCPHGHWANGRFHDAGLDKVQKDIEQGGERFEEGGRSPLQARCVQLARMGCVVFHYDMIGYADSVQIPMDVAHRFAKQRSDMNAAQNWGLFSPQAESHCQSVMGLQAFNSIRALDFLATLPDVDSDRLAVTGASGGGTQTFILAAIDPRPAVAFPAVMVSTAMQGGCTCENACDLRIGTGNVEFAALFGPKPLALSAAKDWTQEMETKGLPELQQLYRLLEAPDNVQLTAKLNFGHNYNLVSRTAMYHWFNRHLQLGLPEPIQERDYQRLTEEEMSVWDEQHPRPPGGPDFERSLLGWWNGDAKRQLSKLTPKDAGSLETYRQVVGGALDVVIGRGLPPAEAISFVETSRSNRDGYVQIVGLLRYKEAGEELPLVRLEPEAGTKRTVVWLHSKGKAGLFDEDGKPVSEIRILLDAGVAVLGVDLLFQGEFLADGKTLTHTRRVENPREAAAYTFGYNPSVFARRTQDVLSVISYAQHQTAVDLIGLGEAGPWAAAARSQAGDAVRRAAISTRGFRFGRVQDLHDPFFLPGGAKYGDLPGMLAVAAPGKLWLAGEGAEPPRLIRAAYRACEETDCLTAFDGPNKSQAASAVKWLLAD